MHPFLILIRLSVIANWKVHSNECTNYALTNVSFSKHPRLIYILLEAMCLMKLETEIVTYLFDNVLGGYGKENSSIPEDFLSEHVRIVEYVNLPLKGL